MKVSDVINRARILLNDTDASGYRWSDAELINYINDAQLMIAVARPDSSVGSAVATLVAGTKQALPAEGFRLMDVIRNIKADDSPGRAVRITDRDTLDLFEPGWHTRTPVAEVKHYIYDEANPLEFYVYPPAAAGLKIELRYTKRPGLVVQATDELSLTDAYFEPTLMYVMYRSYLKDLEFAGNATLAGQYLQAASGLLGVKLTKDNAYSPKIKREGGSPDAVAAQIGGVV
jgi:hypothetical protein